MLQKPAKSGMTWLQEMFKTNSTDVFQHAYFVQANVISPRLISLKEWKKISSSQDEHGQSVSRISKSSKK